MAALCDGASRLEKLADLHPLCIRGWGPGCKALTLGRALAWSLQSSIHQPRDLRQGPDLECGGTVGSSRGHVSKGDSCHMPAICQVFR